MKTITVYTTPQCRFCGQLKEYLKDRGLSFQEFNVIEELEKLDEMKRFSGGSLTVPVVVFNKDSKNQSVCIGFQPDMIERELA